MEHQSKEFVCKFEKCIGKRSSPSDCV